MDKEIIVKLHKNFEDYVHNKDGVEFWYARELQVLLGYDKWSNFEMVIKKAKIACENVKQRVEDHFADVGKTIDMPKGASKEIQDFMLTRYACYLIAQNGDPRKDEIAFAMTYFAIQTRKQEIIEKRLAEIERIKAREKLTVSEKVLSGVLFERGVDHQGFARIRSKGDQALFGGNTTQDMKNKLGVPEKRALADFLPSVTIKAKDLANEMTSFNVKKDSRLAGENPITGEHVRNNESIRRALAENGILPELLPAEEDIKKVERKLNSEGKKISRESKKLNKGFSLIEMIVYIAIFSMFVGALVAFMLNINSSRLKSQTMLEVKGQGADLMRILTNSITNATVINYPGTGLTSGTLSVGTSDVLKNPIIFSGSGEAIYITEGANSAIALTNNKVKVTDLSFTNVSKINTPGVIQIRFTISNTALQTLPEQQYSINFYGTASLR